MSVIDRWGLQGGPVGLIIPDRVVGVLPPLPTLPTTHALAAASADFDRAS